VLSFLWRRDFLIPHDGIRKLIDDQSLSQPAGCQLPVHIVTTDIITGDSVCCRKGSTAEAIVALGKIEFLKCRSRKSAGIA